MAHTVNPDRTYHLLQQRLDRNVTGAPDSPVFTQILKLLFSTEEADIARQMPTQFTSLGRLARKLEVDPAALDDRLTRMAQRGLVLDVERHGRRYFTLAPVVIGFFEFTFMRTRDNLPMAELARLFEEYFFQDDRFARRCSAVRHRLAARWYGRKACRSETMSRSWTGNAPATLSKRPRRMPYRPAPAAITTATSARLVNGPSAPA